jgi:hypothetical protein
MSLSRFLARLTAVKLSIASVAAFLLWLALASFGPFSPLAAGVQNPHGAQLVPVKADTTKKPAPPAPVSVIVPPGSDLYVAQRGDNLPLVARKYLKRTKYLTSSELTEAIRDANHNRQGVFLKSGEQIIIPGILESAIVEKPVPVARDFEVRAIYLTGSHGGQRSRQCASSGIGAKSAATRLSSISRIATASSTSLSTIRWPADSATTSRSAQVRSLPAFAKHARHRSHRHLPRRASGYDHPELAVKSHQHRPALARERQTRLDRSLEPQGAGLRHRASEVRSPIRSR